MYTSYHSAIGATICMIVPSPIGVGLAFLSHHYIDKLQETPYKDIEETKEYEVLLHLILVTAIIVLSHSPIYVILGVIAANLMDVFDKYRYYILDKEQILPCHRPSFKYWVTIKRTRVTNILAIAGTVFGLLMIL